MAICKYRSRIEYSRNYAKELASVTKWIPSTQREGLTLKGVNVCIHVYCSPWNVVTDIYITMATCIGYKSAHFWKMNYFTTLHSSHTPGYLLHVANNICNLKATLKLCRTLNV